MTNTQRLFRLEGKSLLWLTYGLYALVLPSIFGWLISTYETRALSKIADDSRDENSAMAHLLWTHHEWLRRTFVLFVLFAMMALGTAYYGFGLALAAGLIVWWVYRVVRGMVTLGSTHSMPVSP